VFLYYRAAILHKPPTMLRAATYLVTVVCLFVAHDVAVAQEAIPTDSLRVEVAEDESAAAEILITTVGPGRINFQGFAEFSGVPYTGSLNVAFRIFAVASGGTDVWGELQTVDVNEGVFTAEIGAVNPLTLPFDKPYWLAIRLGTDPWMTERVKFLESPYAFTAAAIQGKPVAIADPVPGEVLSWSGTEWTPVAPLSTDLWSPSGANIFRQSGNVSIGTASPEGKMHITSNSSVTNPHLFLHENGNDYARINFKNNNGSNYWSIAAYIASNHRNDRLNIWNGTGGDVVTITGDGEVGIGVGISPKVDFHVGNGRRVLFGIDTLGNGDKLMFLPDLHAFRVGTIATGAASTYWNADSIGLYSFASGLNTRAQGFGATAMGRDTEATNSYAFATGFFSNADGQYSTAMGFNTDAFALGSTALGYSTDAEANYSFAAGYFAEAQAIYSVAIGNAVRAQSYASMAVGRYNVGGGSATSWITTDPIFEVGIGTGPSTRANAITVRKNGNVGIGTTFPGARLHVANGALRIGSLEEITDGGSFLLDFGATLRPEADGTRSLGNSSKRWNTVYATNGTISTSDRRLKQDVESIAPALDMVMQLNPVSYRWNSGVDRRKKFGLVAQEVMNIIPEAVETTEFVQDEETGLVTEVPAAYFGINYSKLIPFLIKSIQEQEATIQALTARVQQLEVN
jgi:hypothetical protein